MNKVEYISIRRREKRKYVSKFLWNLSYELIRLFQSTTLFCYELLPKRKQAQRNTHNF